MYIFDEKYFDIIDTANKAYLLGFICTDGCLYKREGHQGQLSISIKNIDVEIIHHFKESLQSNHPIAQVKDPRRSDTTMNTIVFISEILYNSLLKLGLSDKKTFLLDYQKILSNIPTQFHSAFFLGLFDGDGNIDYPKNGTISKSHVRLSGPIEQLQQLFSMLPEELQPFLTIIKDKRNYSKPFGSLEAKNTIGKYYLLKYLYYLPIQSLKRKKENFKILTTRIEQNVTNRLENKKALLFWENRQWKVTIDG